MMPSLKLAPLMIILLIIIFLAGLSFIHRQHPVKPVDERRLSPCPAKPNCVSSISQDTGHAVQAFSLLKNDRQLSWKKLLSAIHQSGGEVLLDDGEYLHAVFTSKLFRFKDDLEAVINDERIDIRSASRAGRSDLGMNRKTVEKIRSHYLE